MSEYSNGDSNAPRSNIVSINNDSGIRILGFSATVLFCIYEAIRTEGVRAPAALGLNRGALAIEMLELSHSVLRQLKDSEEQSENGAPSKEVAVKKLSMDIKRARDHLIGQGVLGYKDGWYWLTGKKVRGFEAAPGQGLRQGYAGINEKPQTLEEIDPDRHYTRSQLSDIAGVRGVRLIHLLINDDLAPKGIKAGAAIVTLGADLIEYASNNIYFNPLANKNNGITNSGHDVDVEAGLAEAARKAVDLVDWRGDDPHSSVRKAAIEFFIDIARDADLLTTVLTTCGVYILSLNGEIQYIGQSTNLLSRINTHRLNPEMKFDSVKILSCPLEYLDEIEGLLIKVIRPPMNKWTPETNNGAPKSKIYHSFIDVTGHIKL